jgi:Guanylate kinase
MIILSGPSTIGKNPLIESVCNQFNYKFIVPVTTRTNRPNEENAKDYFFLGKETFKQEITDKKICEWDYCLSNYYGFYKFNPKEKGIITHSLSRMAMRFKEKEQSITTIFIMPENSLKVEQTIKKIYSGLELDLRMELLKEEITHSTLFDYIFIVEKSTDLICNPDFISIIEKNK